MIQHAAIRARMCIRSTCPFPTNTYSRRKEELPPQSNFPSPSSIIQGASSIESGVNDSSSGCSNLCTVATRKSGAYIDYECDLKTMLLDTKSPCTHLPNALDMSLKLTTDSRSEHLRLKLKDNSPTTKNSCNTVPALRFAPYAEVREYPIILGDNPSVANGPALTMDWDVISEQLVHINHQPGGQERILQRENKPRKRSRRERATILQNVGYSSKEIQDGVRIVRRAHRQRLVTSYETEAVSQTLEMFEDIRTKVWNVLTLGVPRTQKERAFLRTMSNHNNDDENSGRWKYKHCFTGSSN